MKKIIVTLLALSAVFAAKTATAQTTSDLGTWSSIQLVKSFGAPYAMARLEHRSYDHVQDTECWFAMAGGGYNFNSWLKGDLSYEYWQIPAAGGITQHKAVLCLTETLKRDGLARYGLDFGFTNDPTAIVASIVKDDNIYVFKEFTGTGKTNQQIADIIVSMGFSKSTIIADSAEPKSVAEIKRCGIQRIRESTKGKDSIIHGIQRLQGYNIIVHPSCENIITELENYSWIKDKATGEYTNKPIDMFNHSLDALRYSLQALDAHKFTAVDKSLLGL